MKNPEDSSLPDKESVPVNVTAKIMSPPVVKNTTLDKSLFTKTISIPTILIPETEVAPSVFQKINPYILKIRGFRTVVDECCQSDGARKLKKIYLDPDLFAQEKCELSTYVQQKLTLDMSTVECCFEDVTFTYDHWTYSQLLDSILPDDNQKVSGYSLIGHIIHLNLKEHILPYKKIIGEILLDKISRVKTVVNKLESINNKYRNFEMEVLAGDLNTVVSVKENRCIFEFDFAKVYWNPRLSTEHERLVQKIKYRDTLYDVFGGVGPFAIPAGKKKCFVLANDLNPECFNWLEHNVKKNKVVDFVKCFNMDGEDFIKQVVSQDLAKKLKEADEGECFLENYTYHVVMNLPAIAVEFLRHFWGIVNQYSPSLEKLRLIIHVHCFVKDSKDPKKDAVEKVKQNLCYNLQEANIIEVKMVRIVAPNKEMLCVSFSMPKEILCNLDRKNLKRKHCESYDIEEEKDFNKKALSY